MTKYWIRENGQQSGPFSLEELQLRTFAKGDTFVWHKGLEGWMHIENVPELAHLIAPEPAAEPVASDVTAMMSLSFFPSSVRQLVMLRRQGMLLISFMILSFVNVVMDGLR